MGKTTRKGEHFPNTQAARDRLRIILYVWLALITLIFYFASVSTPSQTGEELPFIATIVFFGFLYAALVGMTELTWYALRAVHRKLVPVPSLDAKGSQHRQSAKKEIRIFVIICVILSLPNLLPMGIYWFWWHKLFMALGILSLVLLWLYRKSGLHLSILSTVGGMAVLALTPTDPSLEFVGSPFLFFLYVLWVWIAEALLIRYLWRRRIAFDDKRLR
jgi:hypothetical protein